MIFHTQCKHANHYNTKVVLDPLLCFHSNTREISLFTILSKSAVITWYTPSNIWQNLSIGHVQMNSGSANENVACNRWTQDQSMKTLLAKSSEYLPSFFEKQSSQRPKKKKCVFTVTCQKNLGSVGRDYFFIFFIIDKTGNSRSRFRNPIPVFNFRKFL